ncbi:MAG TPA: HAMP domain-containing sensor histidine kinase [Gemmatimonadaceae bacterium]|jgi:signal transduction histidine kinase|nr:HAMP domain-containing sensor histidine kinase [Gemmatimonadaceae bacterium]
MDDADRDAIRVSQHVAAAIAHELRTPVFAIASAARLLRYRITDDPVVETNIGRILRDAERLHTLVDALLEYGRPAPVRLVPADPDEIWASVIASHAGQLESRAIAVRHTPSAPRGTCGIDALEFAQACSNVLGNAIDASPEGSDIVIASSTAADGRWTSRVDNPGGPIAAEILPNVFEPLVTNKAGHPGIGLAATRRILAEHGGAVSLNGADANVTVTFSLPAARRG